MLLVTSLTKLKHRRTTKLIGLSLFAFVFFIVFYKKDNLDIDDIDKSKIESFDLILSKGQSMQSKLISLLNFTTNDYSHIGVLIKEDGELFVLHSTPDGTKTNGIRYDDLQTFLDLSNVSDCKILRHTGISESNRFELAVEVDIYKSVQKPFDFDFDNFSDEKIYCSELIWLIFKKTELMEKNIFDIKKPIHPRFFNDKKEFVSVNFKKTSP